MWLQGIDTEQGDIGCVGRGTLGMRWVLKGIVTWGARTSPQGLGRIGAWSWGHKCDWGGHGWYRGYWLVLGLLKHQEVTQLESGAGVTQRVLVWGSGCHILWGQTEWDDTKGPGW